MTSLEKPAHAHQEAKAKDRTYLFGSIMSTPVRQAYGLGPLIQLLEEQGREVAPFLEAAEIPRFALEEPAFPIRLDQEIKFTELALAKLDLPASGLIVGERYHLSMFGVLGLAAACAPTPFELVRTILTYPALAWGMFETSLWRDEEYGYLVFEENAGLGECGPFFIERDVMCGVIMTRDVLGQSYHPARVRFRHKAPEDLTPYLETFGCEVLFDQPVNEVQVPSAVWNTPLPQANDMSRRFFENQCRKISETLAAPLDYAGIVRARLKAANPIPSLSELASALYLTERTLQRRLAAEHVRFSDLLQETRLARAREYLLRANLGMDDIAERLGFKDAVAFSHAFKEWTGTSPGHFRALGEGA